MQYRSTIRNVNIDHVQTTDLEDCCIFKIRLQAVSYHPCKHGKRIVKKIVKACFAGLTINIDPIFYLRLCIFFC